MTLIDVIASIHARRLSEDERRQQIYALKANALRGVIRLRRTMKIAISEMLEGIV